MAAIKPENPTGTSPNIHTPSICVDPLDIDQYINHDNLAFPSPSLTPEPPYTKSSVIDTPTSSSQAFIPNQQPPQQTFSGPSHQYEQYRQQASLPVGAVANTFALNESERFSEDLYDMKTAPQSYFGMNNTDDLVDFGLELEQSSMSMDFSAPSQHMPVLNSSYVDPSAVDGRNPSPNPQSAPAQPVRAWPGMHQKQAAMQAKAQAEAQAQRQQRPRQQSASRSHASSHAGNGSTDPHVEESISRLLDRMRHSSVNSSVNDDGVTSDANGQHAHSARMKKDEEDMDEDERLLASEAGKKLSSKERRQLRNKVSARAFRSRRKEYIGQLEGEIAAKSAEAESLRAKSEALLAENSRLTDLTRMLLSSPHFSNFLGELSATGGSLPDASHTTASKQQKEQQQQQHFNRLNQQQAPPRKDVNSNELQSQGQHQNSMRVGLAMIPEHPFEHAAATSTKHGWAASNTVENDLYDAQVYMVTSLPEEPILDVPSISGKAVIEPLSSFGSMKDEVPEIERMPEVVPKDLPTVTELYFAEDDAEYDDSDPSFALYANPRAASIPISRPNSETVPEDRIFGDVALEKAFGRLELIVSNDTAQNGHVHTATMAKFSRIKSKLDDLGARVEAATAHLS